MKTPQKKTNQVAKRRTRVVLLAAIAAFSSGCASFKVGEPTTETRVLFTTRETTIDAVKALDVSLNTQKESVVAEIIMSVDASVSEHQTIETATIQKKVAVGAWPGARADLDRENYPFFLACLNVPLSYFPFWPASIYSVFIEPFRNSYPPSEDIGFSYFLVGCFKYSTMQKKRDKRITPIQTCFPRDDAVPNATITMDIPDLHFRDSQHTDADGRATFNVYSGNIRQARATVRLTDVSASPYATHLQPFVGKEWTFNLRFDPASAPTRPNTGGRPALPAPSWPIQSVAIADVALAGLSADEGRTMGEWFFNTIAETGYFRLVARADMKRILDEQKFQSENCTDTDCLVDMGRLLAARYMIGGRIARFQNQTVFTARLVDVETSEVLATARETAGTSTKEMLGLMSTVAESLCREYGRKQQDGKQLNTATISRFHNRPHHLHIVPKVGGRSKHLATHVTDVAMPHWGKNGLIVFTAVSEGRQQVFTINPSTEELRQITSDNAHYEHPFWAPDSRHFVCKRITGDVQDICVADSLGTAIWKLPLPDTETYSMPS